MLTLLSEHCYDYEQYIKKGAYLTYLGNGLIDHLVFRLSDYKLNS